MSGWIKKSRATSAAVALAVHEGRNLDEPAPRPATRRGRARVRLALRPATAQEAAQAAQGAELLKLWKRQNG